MPPPARSTHKTGVTSAILTRDDFTMAERFNVLPRVIPFVLLLTGVMIALYGGYATPSETAGLGGLLALVLIALDLQRVAAERSGADPEIDDPRIPPC